MGFFDTNLKLGASSSHSVRINTERGCNEKAIYNVGESVPEKFPETQIVWHPSYENVAT